MPCARNHNPSCAYGVQGWAPSQAHYYPTRDHVRRIEWFGSESKSNTITVRNDILSFRIRCNAVDRDNDVGGTFMPEAYYFSYFNSAPIQSTYIINNGECIIENDELKKTIPNVRMKTEILNVLDGISTPQKVIAFFCHGFFDGIQLGFNLRNYVQYQGNRLRDVEALARAIGRIGTRDVRIPLYACLAGRDDDGFAAQLRDELVAYCPNCLVDAHTNARHATWNPYVKRFVAPAGSNGCMIVPENHRLWPEWRRLLSNPFGTQSTLVWKYSQMTIDKIHTYLDNI